MKQKDEYLKPWLGRYIDLIKDINIPYKDIEKIIEDFRPSKLYRYRNFGEYWKSEIFEGKVYMSSAADFNDPFDSQFYIDYEKMMDYEKDKLKPLYSLWDETKFRSAMSKVIPTKTDILKEKFQNYIRIACFSETNKSILMWSHYARNHEGFCIEYDVNKIDNLYKQKFLPVVYSNEKYEASQCQATGSYNIAYNPALFKALEWRYEREWRLFATENEYKDENRYAYFEKSISAIYLGAKCNKNDEVKQILDWAKKKRIPVYKMTMARYNFELIEKKYENC